MKILIAGGAGYLGSVLVPYLIGKGHEVEVMDLLWFGNYLPEQVKIVKKDILDCRTEDLATYDQVIFLAGLSNDPMAGFNPAMNFISNGAAPAYLAFLAKNAGVKKFIYGGSCSVYGFTENEIYNEDCVPKSQYPYGISKLQGEKGVLQLQEKNFSVIAFRMGTISGYSPRMRFDLFVNTLFKDALTRNKICIKNPDIKRPLLDIRDAVTAYHQAVEADNSINGIFNIASKNYSVGEVGELIVKEINKLTGQKIEMEVNHIADLRNYLVSWEKAKKYLNYTPQFSARDTINDLFINCQNINNFEDDIYYNINTFKKLF